MKFEIKEEIELSDQEIFVLTEIDKLGGEVHYGFDKYLYLRIGDNKESYMNLIKFKLIASKEEISEWEYIKYFITEKGKFILSEIKKQRRNDI